MSIVWGRSSNIEGDISEGNGQNDKNCGKRVLLLTRRELECLDLAAAGKSEWEISRILGISEHTSEKHLLNAKTKLQAVNRAHAVAEAMRRGFIA